MGKQLEKSDFIGKKITDIDIVYQKYFGYDNYDKPVCAISSITLKEIEYEINNMIAEGNDTYGAGYSQALKNILTKLKTNIE